jgi:hypothetical protein
MEPSMMDRLDKGIRGIGRRSFLGSLAAGSAAVTLLPRTVLGAPPIVQPELTPQQFGATGGNAAADTAGWNRAVAKASELGRPVVAKGTYVLQAPKASRWNWWRRPAATTHVAVQLRSGVHILAKDATILVGTPEGPEARDQRHILFGTDLNVVQGTLRDIVFDGLTFDFRDEFGPVHGFTYAMGFVGVDDVVRRNLTIKSSGTKAGRGMLSENIRRRTDTNLKHYNIVQGIYARYEHDVTMRGISFDTFNEAMDFDGPCWNVTLENLNFKNASNDAQCIDTGGGKNWLIDNVVAENTGSIVFIYVKGDARPAYKDWLDGGGQMTTDYVPPQDWVVRNVRGVNAGRLQKEGRKGEALRIGTYRHERWFKKTHGGPSPRNITIENWNLEGGSPMAVNDCANLKMRHIVLNGSVTPDDPKTGAALVLREPDPAYGGEVTGEVSDVVIRKSRGMGVSIEAGSGLALTDITVEGFDLSGSAKTRAGVRIRPRPGRTDTARLTNVRVTGGNASTVDIDR